MYYFTTQKPKYLLTYKSMFFITNFDNHIILIKFVINQDLIAYK